MEWGRVCLLGSQRASLGLLVPCTLALPPETPSPTHTSCSSGCRTCLRSFPWACSALFPIPPVPPSQHTRHPFASPRSPSPLSPIWLQPWPQEKLGGGESKWGYCLVAGRSAEDTTWCLAGRGDEGVDGGAILRSLESFLKSWEPPPSPPPRGGLSNPQPVFFSFEMEPPSPDSRVTS